MKPPEHSLRPIGHRNTAQIIIALLLILLLAYKLTLVVREGLAWLYALPADELMNQWQAQADSLEGSTPEGEAAAAFVPPASDWQAVLYNSERALALAPDNPVYHANLGRLYQFMLEDQNLSVSDMEAMGRKSLRYYQQAARMRPTWTYYWWNIALTEYQLFHYHSDNYQTALRNMIKYGPMFADVQYVATDLALETWGSLDELTRQTVVHNIDRALEAQPQRILELIDQHGAWGELCTGQNQLSCNPQTTNTPLAGKNTQ